MTRTRPAWLPDELDNVVDGAWRASRRGDRFEKLDPHDGSVLWRVAASDPDDVDEAVSSAQRAQPAWAATPGVARGVVLHRVANLLEARADELAAVVSLETGKSPKEALGEVGAAVAVGRFFAGEGQRLYGRTTTSGTPGRMAMTVRDPIGVAGLVVPANTPIANVAWKAFPALICGNAAVVKSAEDAPATAAAFALLAAEAGVPDGVLAVLHGVGSEAGAALVAHEAVGVISFTGSTAVGREIARVAGQRLAKVSLELGGRNAFVVCDDADLDEAVRWATLSAFSNAGQRCASGSRIVVLDAVYDDFVARLVEATSELRVGPGDDDDLGPVINQRALERILGAIEQGRAGGARVLVGGNRLVDAAHAGGFYLAPTIVEGADPTSTLGCDELFGPVTVLRRVPTFDAAIAEVAASPYGLTAAVHTTSWDRAMRFVAEVRTGVVSVNGGTYGSEPHMPFGGTGASGNGTREPGTEALDVYSELKDLYLHVMPSRT